MSPIKGRQNMICRPAGFSDDDSDENDNDWGAIRTNKVQLKQCANPQKQFEDAIIAGNLEELKSALEKGANVHCTDSAGYTGLMLACSYGHSHIVQYLVDQQSNINVCTSGLIYPLMVVCFSTSSNEQLLLECVRILCKEYVNINAMDVHGTTALMYACKVGHCLLVDELIKSGANVHMLDSQKWSALHHATNAGNAVAIESLLAAGAKKRVKDAKERRPFQIAMSKPSTKYLAASLCPKRFRQMLEPELQDVDIFEFKLEETAFQAVLRKMNSINEYSDRRRPKKKGQQLNLYEFLTTTEEELQALGMELSWHRRQTLEYIKDYTLQPWERLVQPRLTKKGKVMEESNAARGITYKSLYPKLTYMNSAHLLIGISKRLQVIQASAKHAEMYLDSGEFDEKTKKIVFSPALNIKQLEQEISKLLQSLELHDHEPIIPADLIVGKPVDVQKNHCSKVTKICGVLFMLAFATWKVKEKFICFG